MNRNVFKTETKGILVSSKSRKANPWYLCCVVFFLFFCIFGLRLTCPVLPVSLDCPYLMALSVFSNIYCHRHFICFLQCNKKRIVDYPNMWGYVRDIYQTKAIEETVDPEHIKCHYQVSQYIDRYGFFIIYEDIMYFSRNDLIFKNKIGRHRRNGRPWKYHVTLSSLSKQQSLTLNIDVFIDSNIEEEILYKTINQVTLYNKCIITIIIWSYNQCLEQGISNITLQLDYLSCDGVFYFFKKPDNCIYWGFYHVIVACWSCFIFRKVDYCIYFYNY